MKKFASFKVSSELSVAEKKLLHARLFMRNKQWDSAIEALESIETESTFLKAEKHAVMGSCFLYMSQYENAAKNSLIAFNFASILNDRTGMFITNYNTSVAYNRIGLDILSYHFINESAQYTDSLNQEVLVKRALACHFSRKCEYSKAITLIEQLLEKENELREYDRDVLLTVVADIYIRAKEYKKALHIPARMKKSYTNREKGRIFFFHSLLEFLVSGESLGQKPESVKDMKEFNLQWDILTSVIGEELVTA